MASHSDHRDDLDEVSYLEVADSPGIVAAMIAIGVLASLVVLAFYALNAT